MLGSSAESHQAFAVVVNSSLILARSLETTAVPVSAPLLGYGGKPLPPLNEMVGQRVVLQGFTAKPEFNGRVGTVQLFQPETSRFHVDLDKRSEEDVDAGVKGIKAANIMMSMTYVPLNLKTDFFGQSNAQHPIAQPVSHPILQQPTLPCLN